MRKITTGWGTLFPTLSTASRIFCIADFDVVILAVSPTWLMTLFLLEACCADLTAAATQPYLSQNEAPGTRENIQRMFFVVAQLRKRSTVTARPVCAPT